jgi:hypothetical protein
VKKGKIKHKRASLPDRVRAAKTLESGNNAYEMVFWIAVHAALHKGETKSFADLLRRLLLKSTPRDRDTHLQLLMQTVDSLAALFEVGVVAFMKETSGQGRTLGSPQIRSLLLAKAQYRRLRKHGAIVSINLDGSPEVERFSRERALNIAFETQNNYAKRVANSQKYLPITLNQLRDAVDGKNPNVRKAEKRQTDRMK